MSKLEIITVPDPILRKLAEPVERIDDELGRLIDGMLDAMYEAPGIGLAAPQVGVSRRLVVIDVSEKDGERNPLVLVNPQILHRSSETSSHEEGCLSIPDVKVEIERPAKVRVRFLDRAGHEQTLDADGLLATAVQHEIDHLDGRLIIDFLSRLKRDMIIRRFKKQSRSETA